MYKRWHEFQKSQPVAFETMRSVAHPRVFFKMKNGHTQFFNLEQCPNVFVWWEKLAVNIAHANKINSLIGCYPIIGWYFFDDDQIQPPSPSPTPTQVELSLWHKWVQGYIVMLTVNCHSHDYWLSTSVPLLQIQASAAPIVSP